MDKYFHIILSLHLSVKCLPLLFSYPLMHPQTHPPCLSLCQHITCCSVNFKVHSLLPSDVKSKVQLQLQSQLTGIGHGWIPVVNYNVYSRRVSMTSSWYQCVYFQDGPPFQTNNSFKVLSAVWECLFTCVCVGQHSNHIFLCLYVKVCLPLFCIIKLPLIVT